MYLSSLHLHPVFMCSKLKTFFLVLMKEVFNVQEQIKNILIKAVEKCQEMKLHCSANSVSEVNVYRLEMEGITVKGKGCPKPIKTWVQCGISMKILTALKK